MLCRPQIDLQVANGVRRGRKVQGGSQYFYFDDEPLTWRSFWILQHHLRKSKAWWKLEDFLSFQKCYVSLIDQSVITFCIVILRNNMLKYSHIIPQKTFLHDFNVLQFCRRPRRPTSYSPWPAPI